MAPEFEKANEIYFRLGIIYKQQQKFSQSLEVRSIIKKKICGKSRLTLISASNTLSTTPHVP
jgi:hypothetical protein